MLNCKLLPTLILTTLTPLTVSVPAHALSLLDNLTPTSPSDGGRFGVGEAPFLASGEQNAIGFTLPGGSNYILNSIDLRLSSYNSNDGDIPELSIFEDPTRTSANPNEAMNQAILQAFPPFSSSNATNTFTFTPSTPFTFRANTRYWLLVDAAQGFFFWAVNGSNPGRDYSSDVIGVTTVGFVTSGNNGASYDSGFGAFRPGLRIRATAVPVPFEFHGGAGLTLLVAAGWLARRRKAASS